MGIEDFKPLYNNRGQVNDPEIARVMAESEEELRNNPEDLEYLKKLHGTKSDQETIDKVTEITGENQHDIKYKEYLEKRMDGIVEKLKGALTEEEVDILKEYITDEEDGDMDIDFLFELLKGEGVAENKKNEICKMHASNMALLQSEKMKSEVKMKMGEVMESEIENVVTEIYKNLEDMYYNILANDKEPQEKIIHINFMEYKLVPDIEKIKEIREEIAEDL